MTRHDLLVRLRSKFHERYTNRIAPSYFITNPGFHVRIREEKMKIAAEDEWLETQARGKWARIRLEDMVDYHFVEAVDAVMFMMWFG
jgi:hypothetical protein